MDRFAAHNHALHISVPFGTNVAVERILFLQARPSGGSGESLLKILEHRPHSAQDLVVLAGEGELADRFRELRLARPPIRLRLRSWLDFGPRTLNNPWNLLRWMAGTGLHAVGLTRLLTFAWKARVQLVHTNCPHLIDGALVAASLGLPHVWHVRELLDLDWYSYQLPKRAIAAVMDRLSSVVLCNSERTRLAVERLGVTHGKIRVIYNIVQPPLHTRDLRVLLRLAPGSRVVLMVGQVRPLKRVEDFVAVASLLHDRGGLTKFVIMGGWGPASAYTDEVRRLIEASPNRSNIIVTGHVANAPDYMPSADVLVCPSNAESFGRVVAEALSGGTPAVGIQGSAAEEILDQELNGLLVPNRDVYAMAAATRRILGDSQLARRMGESGMAKIERKFSARVILPQLDALHSELAT